jgi:methanogenic corrinoid protein MtbC1/DNA-binding XRE family transcriptional regulator
MIPATDSKQTQTDKLVDAYVDALVSGDEHASGRIVQEALARDWTLCQVYSNLFNPAHEQTGELARNRAMTKAHLHRATQITLSHMERLRSQLPTDGPRGHRVMVTVIEGDEQMLGTLMLADVFRADGWAVDLIGRSIPLKDLLQLVKERKPEVMVLSSDAGIKSEKLGKLLKAVQRLFPQPPAIILGRTRVDQNSAGGRDVPGIYVARDLEEALKVGRDAVASTPPDFELSSFLETLGGRIRQTRRGLSLTQQQLADKAKLDRTYIVAVERGRQNVTVGAVMRIAEALGVPIDLLLVSGKVGEAEAKGST